MKKRVLSALLALAIVLTLMPVSVFATDPSTGTLLATEAQDTTPPAAEDALEILEAGILDQSAANTYFTKILGEGWTSDIGSAGQVGYVRLVEPLPQNQKALIEFTIQNVKVGEETKDMTYGIYCQATAEEGNSFFYWDFNASDTPQIDLVKDADGTWRKAAENDIPTFREEKDLTVTMTPHALKAETNFTAPPNEGDITASGKEFTAHYNAAPHIIDFGYGETSTEAEKKAREKNPSLNPQLGNGWKDQTMWVTFDRPLSDGETVTVKLSMDSDSSASADVAELTCTGNGYSRTWAWSFLNPEQVNEGVTEATPGATYTMTATDKDGGELTPENGAALTCTLETLRIVGAGQYKDRADLTQKLTAISAVGGYTYQVTDAGGPGYYVVLNTRLPADQKLLFVLADSEGIIDAVNTGSATGTGTLFYWSDSMWDEIANENKSIDADHYQLYVGVYDAQDDPSDNITAGKTVVTLDETTGAPTNLGEGVSPLDADSKATKDYGADVHLLPTETLTVQAMPMNANNSTSEDKLVADADGGNAGYRGYHAEVKAVEDSSDPADYIVTIYAKDVKLHADEHGMMGYWVGFTLKSPVGATKVVWSQDWDPAALTVDNANKTDTVSIDSSSAKGIILSSDAGLEINQGTNARNYVMVRWFNAQDETMGGTMIYRVIISDQDPSGNGSITDHIIKVDDGYVVEKGSPSGDNFNGKKIKLANLADATEGGKGSDVQTGYTLASGWLGVGSLTSENGVSKDNTAKSIGHYVEAVIDASTLSYHKNADGQFGYWAGVSLKAPDNAAYLIYKIDTKPESVLITESTPSEDANISKETDKNFNLYWNIDPDQGLQNSWIGLRWFDVSKQALETVYVHVSLGKNIQKGLIVEVNTAPYPAVQAGNYAGTYTLTKNDPSEEGVIGYTLTAKDVLLHLNGAAEPKEGYWVGVAFVPEVAQGSIPLTSLSYVYAEDKATLETLASSGTPASGELQGKGTLAASELEKDVHYKADGTGEDGIAFYFDAAELLKGEKKSVYFRLTWGNAAPVTYKIDLDLSLCKSVTRFGFEWTKDSFRSTAKDLGFPVEDGIDQTWYFALNEKIPDDKAAVVTVWKISGEVPELYYKNDMGKGMTFGYWSLNNPEQNPDGKNLEPGKYEVKVALIDMKYNEAGQYETPLDLSKATITYDSVTVGDGEAVQYLPNGPTVRNVDIQAVTSFGFYDAPELVKKHSGITKNDVADNTWYITIDKGVSKDNTVVLAMWKDGSDSAPFWYDTGTMANGMAYWSFNNPDQTGLGTPRATLQKGTYTIQVTVIPGTVDGSKLSFSKTGGNGFGTVTYDGRTYNSYYAANKVNPLNLYTLTLQGDDGAAAAVAPKVVGDETYLPETHEGLTGPDIFKWAKVGDGTVSETPVEPGSLVQIDGDTTYQVVPGDITIVYSDPRYNEGKDKTEAHPNTAGKEFELTKLAELGWTMPAGYKFSGWTVEGVEDRYTDGAKVAFDEETVTLTATWQLDVTLALTTTNIVDASGAYTSEQVVTGYKVTSDGQGDGYEKYVVAGDNLRYHQNGEGSWGYWIGFAVNYFNHPTITTIHYQYATDRAALETSPAEDEFILKDEAPTFYKVAKGMQEAGSDELWLALWAEDAAGEQTEKVIFSVVFDTTLEPVTYSFTSDAANERVKKEFYPETDGAYTLPDPETLSIETVDTSTYKWAVGEGEGKTLYDFGASYPVTVDETFTLEEVTKVITLTYEPDEHMEGSSYTVQQRVEVGNPAEFTVLAYTDIEGWSVKEDYHFVKWMMDGEEVKAGEKIYPKEDSTITAVCEEDPKYTVTYQVAEGKEYADGGHKAGKYTLLTAESENIKDLIPEGKLLVKWIDGEGTEYDPGAEVDLNGNVTYTAKLKDETVIVTFKDELDDGYTKEVEVKKNTTVTVPETPEHNGYTFNGWFADGSETAFDFENTPITEALTLTAKYTKQSIPPFVPSPGTSNPSPSQPSRPQNPGVTPAEDPIDKFVDLVENGWYEDFIRYVVENGLMHGVDDTHFGPDMNITRGMVVTILYRAEGEPTVAFTDKFSDVAAGEYFSDAVIWAAENGIVLGYDDGSYRPYDDISREQLAAILYRYASYKKLDVTSTGSLAAFTDADQVSGYAVEAVTWAVSVDLIKGIEDDVLDPTGNATRAQFATILMRYLETLAK